MKVSFIVLLLTIFFIISSFGHITIEIEPNELHQISEILQSFINQQQQQLQPQYPSMRNPILRVIGPLIKPVSVGIIQMIGIKLTPVGSKFNNNENGVNCIK